MVPESDLGSEVDFRMTAAECKIEPTRKPEVNTRCRHAGDETIHDESYGRLKRRRSHGERSRSRDTVKSGLPVGNAHSKHQHEISHTSSQSRARANDAEYHQSRVSKKQSTVQATQRPGSLDTINAPQSPGDRKTEIVDDQTARPPLTEEEEIARRRAMRAEIRAKLLHNSGNSTPISVLGSMQGASPVTRLAEDLENDDAPLNLAKTSQASPSQHDNHIEDGPSAADYDPDIDRIGEHEKHRNQGHIAPDIQAGDDIFEDPDDMFADPEPAKSIPGPNNAQKLEASMLDNWSDNEGYYRIVIGELLDGRYAVQSTLGKGVFAAVVRALDREGNAVVAIKIVRNNDIMRKAGQKEISILQTLMTADPDDRKHIVRFERSFEHRGHLCMVFESLSLNLREVLRKFGRDVGINIKAVRAYAQQIFLGLAHMRKCNIMHADLKPDNILVSESRTLLKICDLGSASDTSENDLTPYLASRFYRAPEVILGLPYDASMDVWAIGCTLYEMYTGKILFPGRSNNQMLKLMMECRGRIMPKLIRKAAFAATHFDDQLNFNSREIDSLTGLEQVRVLNILKPTKDLRARLLTSTASSDRPLMLSFTDFLERCTELDPAKRISPIDALKHPFLARSTFKA